MRQITKQAIFAFENSINFKKSNTEVKVYPNVTTLILHGNIIAYKYNDTENTLSISNAGWPTNTTKERLNGIEGVNIVQRNFVWYLNGKKWDGDLIDIKK